GGNRARGEKHSRKKQRLQPPRRAGQTHPATTTRQQLRSELRPTPIRAKTEAHRQSPENADWLAVDLPNMRSLLHVYKMEHHHQNSQPPRTTTRNEVTMYIHHILRKYRTPQVGKIGNHFWYWKCRQHEQLQFAANWATAYQAATHHARNHYKGWPQ